MATRAAQQPAGETEPKTDGSRYGTVSAQKFDEPAPGSLGAADIEPAMAALRKMFATEKTLSREWRVGQLLALRQLLVEGREELCEAMRADLHKSHFEGYVSSPSASDPAFAAPPSMPAAPPGACPFRCSSAPPPLRSRRSSAWSRPRSTPRSPSWTNG